MTGKNQARFYISIHRWELASIGTVLLLLMVLLGGMSRCGAQVRSEIGKTISRMEMVQQIGAVGEKLRGQTAARAMLDSMYEAYRSMPEYDEFIVLKTLYALSDSTGCRINKVEVMAAIEAESGSEIPVLVSGEGVYGAMGKFVEGIENLAFPTRVRQVTLSGKGVESGAMQLDFIVMVIHKEGT